jgi:hypothetical protein
MALHDRMNSPESETKSILEAYMSRSERLESILTVLTRAYCANCPRNTDYGCCDFADEAVREMPEEAIGLQEEECLQNGGDLLQVNGICRYHTTDGCSLRLMKSSSCLGHLCDDLKENLTDKFQEEAKPFLNAMAQLVSGSLRQDSAALFKAMDEAIALGDSLIDGSGGSS